MANANFASILDAPSSDSVRPPPFPKGNWVCVVKGLPRRGKSDKKQTDFIEYTLQPLQPIEGTVDDEEIEALGGFADKTLKLTYYITDKSGYRHREFLTNDLGVEEEDESHWARAQMAPGHQCIVTIRHKPSDDGKGFYSEIASTAPVE